MTAHRPRLAGCATTLRRLWLRRANRSSAVRRDLRKRVCDLFVQENIARRVKMFGGFCAGLTVQRIVQNGFRTGRAGQLQPQRATICFNRELKAPEWAASAFVVNEPRQRHKRAWAVVDAQRNAILKILDVRGGLEDAGGAGQMCAAVGRGIAVRSQTMGVSLIVMPVYSARRRVRQHCVTCVLTAAARARG